MTFGKNKKRFLLGALGVVFLSFGIWVVRPVPETNAAITEKEFIRIKIDSTSGLGNNSQLWNFFATDNGRFDEFNVTGSSYTESGVTYDCGLLLTEENSIGGDSDYILWAKNGTILGGGTSLKNDIDNSPGGQFGKCCDANGSPSCDVDSGAACNHSIYNDQNYVFQRAYGSLNDNECGEDLDEVPCNNTPGACCELSSNFSGAEYQLENRALCADTGKWKFCDDDSACASDGTNSYACNHNFGDGVWQNCTALGQTCSNGACQIAAVNALSLEISPNPASIPVNGNSTVTFTVRKTSDNSTVSGATITITSGPSCGTLSNAGGTDASGQTTSNFTAPAATGVCTFGAKAALAGYTDGTVNSSISVSSCTGLNYAEYNDYRYVKGESIELEGRNPNASNDCSLCIYNPSNARAKAENKTGCSFPKNTTFTSNVAGVWKGLAIPGQNQCPSSFNASLGCVGSTEVVECDGSNVSNCPSGQCNLSTYTCVAAAPPPPPPAGPGPVSAPLCQSSLIASDVGKKCGSTYVVTQGDVDANSWCCSAANGVAINKTTCQNMDQDCGVAVPPPGPGPVTCGGGLCNPLDCSDIICLIDKVISFLFYLTLPIVTLMIVIAGFLFMTAAGEPQKISQARGVILYALIGFLVILLAKGLVSALQFALGGK